MDAFERKISETFDFNRFEPHPEMQKLISDFEKRYLVKEKVNVKREPISFKELSGGTGSTKKVGRQSAEQLTKERDKGKPR